jgi:hypothetical protein
MRWRIAVCLSGLLAVLLTGCGGSGMLKTKGRIVKNGQPVPLGEEEYFRVLFVPVVEKGERMHDVYAANFNREDGTFQAAGKDGKGLPPGKYRVAVAHLRGKRDLLNNAFDESKSPFVYDVDAKTEEIVIDIAKPKG